MPRGSSLMALLSICLMVAACGRGTTAATATTDGGEATTTTVRTGVRFVASDATEARFVIGEVLFGNETEVVATNSDVSVDVTVDLDDPGRSVIGPVRISADGFTTDQTRRDGAIRQFVLESGNHPEIVFNPTNLGSVAAALAGGSTTVSGDLVIKGVSVPVRFSIDVETVSSEEIVAHAHAVVDRTDWGLSIPSVAQVASVENEVRLEIDLVLVPE